MEGSFRYDCSGKWYRGNVHMHTVRSDGSLNVEEAISFYAQEGYHFISITDHMVPFVAGDWDGKRPLTILDGVELHGYDNQGSFYHVVGIGDVGGVTEDMDFSAALELLRTRGCFLIWAHPHWSGNTVAEGLRYPFDAVEIFNCSSQVGYGKGFGTFHWDAVLERKTDLLGLATDDSHFFQGFPGEAGGWIMVNAKECSTEEIMASIRKGNFYSSSGPLFKSITIEQGNRVVADMSPVVHARLVGPRDKNKYKGTMGGEPMTHTHFRIPDEWPFARLEIEDARGKAAWSNALFKV